MVNNYVHIKKTFLVFLKDNGLFETKITVYYGIIALGERKCMTTVAQMSGKGKDLRTLLYTWSIRSLDVRLW